VRRARRRAAAASEAERGADGRNARGRRGHAAACSATCGSRSDSAREQAGGPEQDQAALGHGPRELMRHER
jgi:hypothetical protein